MTRARRIDVNREEVAAVAVDLQLHPGTSGAEAAARTGIRQATSHLTLLKQQRLARSFYVGPGRGLATAFRWWPSVAGRVLHGHNANDTVRLLTDLAYAGGLRPTVDRVTRRSYRVMLNGTGRQSPCGSLRVSAGKGTFLGANLMWPNGEVPYPAVADIRQALSSWLAIVHGR